ncbi:uncharacterized protein LOC111025158 [Momordica charantia]|uniref:Uncharacterized protein LOC111025158 n=1 Tax=Momordica charantia TaxID=3673 RepID=A0A6J1DWJ0_MOMCH|nr:uncharacterized protein LOC111025158 [Momordica charantia]
MGVCVSTQTTNSSRRGITVSQLESIHRRSTIKIVHMDGLIEEFADPIKASKIASRNPNFLLCNSEQMLIGSCVPALSGDEDLQLGQIYFLIPRCQAHTPLSLPDLCNLAIKASSALRNHRAASLFR